MNSDEEGYPITRPPWGWLSAIDLRNAAAPGKLPWKIVWQVPHGEFRGLTARGIARTGTYIRGGNIVTAGGVIFNAGTLDNIFRAYDAKSGKVLWKRTSEAQHSPRRARICRRTAVRCRAGQRRSESGESGAAGPI
jgi:glucose dehydrogenase